MIQDGYGRPPKGGWAGLVPELYVTDSAKSIRHWCDVFRFTIAYQRPEERFAYLDRPEGSQIMICERCGAWETGAFDHPLGRGVLFQVFVSNVAEIHQSVPNHGYALYAGPREIWRRWGDREGGKREIVVQDPDGYLVMFAESIGKRPLAG